MKKFLIIRFSSIGDMVLTTPVVRCLKKQIPEAEIHYITKNTFSQVIEANPYIDKIYTIAGRVGEVLETLESENYDYIIDLHKNFRSWIISAKLKGKSSTFSKINIKKWLIVNLKINWLPDVHIVDRYFEAVKHLGVKNDRQGLDYFIPPAEDHVLDELPPGHQQRFIGWVIGGKHNTKIYPEEKIIEICRRINHPVVLIGGPEDMEKGSRIEQASGPNVFNACGKFRLNQSASLVKHASLVLTNDTGLMHIAAAFRKPIISFWGNTLPEFGMFPYMPGKEKKSTIMEVSGLSCRPCSKLGHKSCPKKHFRCMKDIDVDQVVRLIRESFSGF